MDPTLSDSLLTGIDSTDKPSATWSAVFEKIAKLLSERWGIQVIMRGTDAYTDGRRIVLPVVPDNAPAELVEAVHGTLDHEAGHVIFSEFLAIPDPLEKLLTNALEDAREETRLIGIWPGCAANLRACTEFFCRRLDAMGWPVTPFTKFSIALYLSARHGDDHWFLQKWVDTCAEIQPHLRVAREILAREPVTACATTTDVLALARKILAAIRALPSAPPPEPEDASTDAEGADAGADTRTDGADSADADDAGDPTAGDSGAGAADTEPEDEAAASGDDAEESGAPEPSAAPDERSPTEAPDSGDAAAGVGLGVEEPPTEATTHDAASDRSATTTDGSALDSGDAVASRPGPALSPTSSKPGCKDITDCTPAELRRDEEYSVQRFLSEQARKALEAGDGAYLAFTTEHDLVETAPDGDRAAYRRSIQTVRGDVATIRRTLARTLLASRKACWERGQGRGKIDPRALHKVALGTSGRVFRKREEAPAFNTRVSLLVDHSGSMMGSRIQLAARAASVFSEVLAELRLPFELLAFTSGPHTDGQQRHALARPEDRALFARWGALRTVVYKSFDEDFRRVSGRLDAMSRFSEGEANYDGDSLLLAARRLTASSKSGERRILFVFSDGCPAGTVTSVPLWQRQVRHLHEAVSQVRRSGIELFGIGIESDSVRTFYPEHVVVNSAADLPREMIRALDRLLRRVP